MDAGCEVYLIRSAGVLGQTAAVLERMRVEADTVAPVERSVEVLPFEGVLADGDVPTELAEPGEPAKREDFARMVFAWELMDVDPRDERDLSDATVVLDEVCRAGDIERTRALMQRAGRVVCRNLGQVAMARELGTALTWRRRCSVPIGPRLPGCAGLARGGYTCLPSCSAMTGSVLPSWLLNPASWVRSTPTVPSLWCASTAC